MAQNIYDNPTFFAAYNTLPRSQEGLAGAPEWPALQTLVGPSAKDQAVLDLGCGYGWFCRWARDQGASSVRGIDVSQQMLQKAQHDWPVDQTVQYERADLDEVDLPRGKFGLVYSSLAFHYVKDIRVLFRKIYDCLVPGGRFVFSIEHPLFTAPRTPKFDNFAGDWTINSYHYEGERIRRWLGEDVKKQHRTITTYIDALLEPGFRLDAFREWKPSSDELKEHADWECEMHRPIFLLMAASKVVE